MHRCVRRIERVAIHPVHEEPNERAGKDEVRMVGQDRVVEMEYTEDVPLLPGVFTYPWKFRPRTSTRMLNAPPR